MIYLTGEQAQQIEEALENWISQTSDTSHLDLKLFAFDTKQALATIRAARAQEQGEQEPAPWKHDCAALCMNDVELWIDNCPHCGKPRTAPSEPVKQKPVAFWNGKETAWFEHELCGHPAPDGCTIPLYAAPVRTKDLTVSELDAIIEKHYDDEMDLKAMILDGIAADRRKNNV